MTIEPIWVIKGYPIDPAQPMWPCTVHDIDSRRVRYQMVPRDALMPILDRGGMATYAAIWWPDRGERGEWQLVDILPDTAREVAA